MKITELHISEVNRRHSENFRLGEGIAYLTLFNDSLILSNAVGIDRSVETEDTLEIIFLCQIAGKLRTDDADYDAGTTQFITEEELERLLTKQMQTQAGQYT